MFLKSQVAELEARIEDRAMINQPQYNDVEVKKYAFLWDTIDWSKAAKKTQAFKFSNKIKIKSSLAVLRRSG